MQPLLIGALVVFSICWIGFVRKTNKEWKEAVDRGEVTESELDEQMRMW